MTQIESTSAKNYFSWMLSGESDAAAVCLVISIVFAIGILTAIFAGIRRGIFRQITHTVFTAAAIVASYLVTANAVNNLAAETAGMSTADILTTLTLNSFMSEKLFAVLSYLDAEVTVGVFNLALRSLLAPAFFTVLFICFYVVAAIAYLIVSRVLIPKNRRAMSRLLGVLISVAEAVVICSIIALPFVTSADTAEKVVADIDLEDETNVEIAEFYEEYAKPVSEFPISALVRALGSDKFSTEFAQYEIDGETVDMRNELVTALNIFEIYLKLENADFKCLTDADKEAVTSLITTATDSPYYANLISGVLRMIASAVDGGVITLNVEAPFDALISDMIAIFETSDKDNLVNDLTTVKNVFFILSDSDLFATAASSEAARNAFTKKDEDGNTVVNLVIAELDKNERTSPLVTTITKLSVAILADSMGEDVTKTYESVKEGINDTLAIKREDFNSDEEHKEAVSESINTTLTENGITLESEIVDTITDFYFENEFDKMEELTDEEVNDLILSYYDAYLKYLEETENR